MSAYLDLSNCDCAAQYGRAWHRGDCPRYFSEALAIIPSEPRTYPTNYLVDAPWIIPEQRAWWVGPE